MVQGYQDTQSRIAAEQAAAGEGPSGGRGAAAQAVLWVFWAAAAAFWALGLAAIAGILQAISRPAPAAPGGVAADAGGLGYALMAGVGGLVVLGLAIAYGAWRYATRDKRNDPASEAATRAVYNAAERAGGDDVVTRSPEARRLH